MNFAFSATACSITASVATLSSVIGMGVVGMGVIGMGIMVPAWADTASPAEPTSSDGAAALYPLEARELEVELDDNRHQTVANQINHAVHGQTESGPTLLDALGSDELDALVDSFVDEHGDVRLPLGLTVYDTMGDPSIGFGNRF